MSLDFDFAHLPPPPIALEMKITDEYRRKCKERTSGIMRCVGLIVTLPLQPTTKTLAKIDISL